MSAQSVRKNILHGAAVPYIAPEGTALPAIDATLEADGQLPFFSVGTDEVQNLALGGATGGTYTLKFIDSVGIGFTTAAIAFDADAAAIQLALGLLEPIGTDGIVVTTGTDFVFTFSGGTVAGQPQNAIILDGTLLTGGSGEVITTTTEGVAAWTNSGFIEDGVMVTYTPTYEDKRVDNSNGPVLSILLAEDLKVSFALSEKDLISMNNSINASTFSVINQASSQIGQTKLGIGDGTDQTIALALQGISAEGFPRLYYFPSCKVTGPNEDKQNKSANNSDIEFTVIADLSKPLGERMAQIFDMTAVALA